MGSLPFIQKPLDRSTSQMTLYVADDDLPALAHSDDSVDQAKEWTQSVSHLDLPLSR
jgi:hypothetical protein